jgi:hypothetical protein
MMKGTHKVSVHPPNDKFPEIGFLHGTEEAHRENMEDPTGKRVEQYFPRELGKGVRRVATIRVYAASLQMANRVTKSDSMIWFNPPDTHLGVDINILLTERQEAARQWCDARQVRPQISIVDESPIGDLHLHTVSNSLFPRLIIRPDDDDPEKRESIVGKTGTVAHSIESVDGSLLIQEVPVVPHWPWKDTG